MIELLLRAERHDGNDPIEAVVRLPIVPRKGDMIELWCTPREGYGYAGTSGDPRWLEVVDVVFTAYAPERIEVWVRLDGYDLGELEHVMGAVDAKVSP